MNNEEKLKEILEAESDVIKKRRKLAGVEEGFPQRDSAGIALSGGGIRSATFNLGLIQALERGGLLKYIDYMSTVSGGGYIGSSLTWLMTKLGKFPFGTSREDHDRTGGKVLKWLRAHGKFLTPGDGLNAWSLAAAVLTGTLVNLMILVPVFVLLFYLINYASRNILIVPPPFPDFLVNIIGRLGVGNDILLWPVFIGLVLLGLVPPFIVFFALSTPINYFRGFRKERRFYVWCGRLLKFSFVFLAIGSIPLLHGFLSEYLHLKEWLKEIMSMISLSGIISLVLGWKGRGGEKGTGGVIHLLLNVGLTVLVYGMMLWFYHLTRNLQTGSIVPDKFCMIFIFLSLLLALAADVNHVSMHRFYRNRLMEAFMPREIEGKNLGNPDFYKLSEIEDSPAPYQIINTNVQTVGSKDHKLRERGGDNFIFSRLYSGSECTGYVKTGDYIYGNMNLATAFAVSGAAVDPNTYNTPSRPLNFLMTLLNIRLGYWIRNPNREGKKGFPLPLRPRWYYYMFLELFGSGLNEKQRSIHLSDGGHFENLGLYELIRRRCRYIIISDAGEDRQWSFSDLAKVIEMARVDFGAEIEISTAGMAPDKDSGLSDQAFVYGKIKYNNGDNGDIIYIKTAVIKELPEDIYGYWKKNRDFPDETTGDQFFNETQFEAYRELGFQIGQRVCSGYEGRDIGEFFR